MAKKPLILVGIIAFWIQLVSTTGVAYDNGDFQIWNTEKFKVKINEKLKFKAEEEFRWGDDALDFYYHHTDAGIVKKVNNYLDLGVNFRHITQKKNSEWKKEERPHINLKLKNKWQDFGFSSRSRLEYRIKEDSPDGWRFRNKFKTNTPWKLTRFNINPYIADEIFLDLGEYEFTRNRLYMGTDMHLIGRFTGDVYYLWQRTDKDSYWQDYHVLGIKIGVEF